MKEEVNIDNVLAIEKKLKQVANIELPVEHLFTENQYIRQLYVPKDTVIVGKRHRYKTLNMLLKGRMLIYDDNETIEVVAPFIVETEEYTKKAGYAIEDSIWCNIHVTNKKDLEEIEEEFIIPEEEYQQLLKVEEQKCLGYQ